MAGGQRISRSSNGKVCRHPTGHVRSCGCVGCVQNFPCALGVVTSCTGLKFARDSMSASGSGNGTASANVSLTNGAVATGSGTISVSFAISLDWINQGGADNVAYAGMEGEFQTWLDAPDRSWSSITPFGTMTVEGGGSVSLAEPPGGGSASGGGSLTLTRIDGTLEVFIGASIAVPGSSTVTTSATIRFTGSVGGSYPLGDFGEEGEVGGAGVSFSFEQTWSGTRALSSSCGTAYNGGTAGPKTVQASMGIDGDFGSEADVHSSSASGSASATIQRVSLSSTNSVWADATECQRYVNFEALFPYTELGEETDIEMHGRVVQLGNEKCSSPGLKYYGGGIYTQGFGEDAYERACDFSFIADQFNTGNAITGIEMRRKQGGTTLFLGWTGTLSGTFTLTLAGETTAALSGHASAEEIQAAIEALPSNAHEFIRVRLFHEEVEGEDLATESQRGFEITHSNANFASSLTPFSRTWSGNFSGLSASGTLATTSILPGGGAADLGATLFYLPGQCLSGTANAAKPINSGYYDAMVPTVSFSPTTRIEDFDPVYFCDCATACEHTSVTAHIEVDSGETFTLTMDSVAVASNDPCLLQFGEGEDRYFGSYGFKDSRGGYELELYDSENDNALFLHAIRFCTPGGQLGPLIPIAGSLYTEYTLDVVAEIS